MIPLRQLLDERLPAKPAPGFVTVVAGQPITPRIPVVLVAQGETVKVQCILDRIAVVHPPDQPWPLGRSVVNLAAVWVEPEVLSWSKKGQWGWNNVAHKSRTRYSDCKRCGKRTQGANLCRECQMVCPTCGGQKSRTGKGCAACAAARTAAEIVKVSEGGVT